MDGKSRYKAHSLPVWGLDIRLHPRSRSRSSTEAALGTRQRWTPGAQVHPCREGWHQGTNQGARSGLWGQGSREARAESFEAQGESEHGFVNSTESL